MLKNILTNVVCVDISSGRQGTPSLDGENINFDGTIYYDPWNSKCGW